MDTTILSQETGENWTMINGDCCEALKGIPDNSIHYSIFSPPFASLYTYSASDRDMGNCSNDTDDGEFFEHFTFCAAELMRSLMPGRLISFHCMNLPTSKERNGYIGIRDFRGTLIRAFQKVGMIYHSEVCIWKDPVTAMQRTKALGLLHKQIRKDSAMSRQGIPDYLVTMRKPGINPEPITHTPESFPVTEWQQLASPVWGTIDGEDHDGFVGFKTVGTDSGESFGSDGKTLGIDAGDTLTSQAEENDERHICCLQIPVIRRGIRLWTNPGDGVLSPFAGVGSEGYTSLMMARKFIGVELKKSYFDQACVNMKRACAKLEEGKLFK